MQFTIEQARQSDRVFRTVDIHLDLVKRGFQIYLHFIGSIRCVGQRGLGSIAPRLHPHLNGYVSRREAVHCVYNSMAVYGAVQRHCLVIRFLTVRHTHGVQLVTEFTAGISDPDLQLVATGTLIVQTPGDSDDTGTGIDSKAAVSIIEQAEVQGVGIQISGVRLTYDRT